MRDCMKDPRLTGYVNAMGWKISEDGKISLTRQQFAKCSLASRSAWNPDLRTLILPTTNGVAVMEEGKHFNVIG